MTSLMKTCGGLRPPHPKSKYTFIRGPAAIGPPAIYLLARGQKLRTALSLVRVEREPRKALSTRENYVTIRSLYALAMPHTLKPIFIIIATAS